MTVPQTIRQGKLGKHELRLARKGDRVFGLVNGKVCIEGADAEAVWTDLQQEAGKADPRYFGYAGARKRFLRFFPGGFASAWFDEEERAYKLRAAQLLSDTAPLDAAAEASGLGEPILAAYRATNLLSLFEKARIQGVLRGPDADAFIRAAAAFALEPGQATLGRLTAVLAPHDCAKWTIATYLPFLWLPDRHMFLKPEVTKDFAARVGHPFSAMYEARPSHAVYTALLDMVARTEHEIRDLGPRDGIDIQSFIWTVGAYVEGRDDPPA